MNIPRLSSSKAYKGISSADQVIPACCLPPLNPAWPLTLLKLSVSVISAVLRTDSVHEQERVKQSTEEVAMSLYDLEHLEMLRDPLTNTKSVVAWGKDTCVVAFRGTANKQNAVHDFKVSFTS